MYACGVLRAIPLPSIAATTAILNSHFLNFFNLQHLFHQVCEFFPLGIRSIVLMLFILGCTQYSHRVSFCGVCGDRQRLV
ncbi:hypothetical protein ERIC1_2c04870 [Paenibacillus larvae subsp. larvae DSM 25719]|nr:hypothetical protein ERIC1_2c04870 [Paenibacillus larvae subsp. larvae DSM 25719]